jgi:hypothetical protein
MRFKSSARNSASFCGGWGACARPLAVWLISTVLIFALVVDPLEQIEEIVGDGFACDVVEHSPKLLSDDPLTGLEFALLFRAQVLSPPPLR